jgi:hypothetical protein
MTHSRGTTAIALAAGFGTVLFVGFFTGWANTWPVIAFVLGGAFLLQRG